MDELGKVKRVVEKHGPLDEVLLVLDATTGQNGLVQARVFAEVVDITGIVLTKLDGTAKGGIVIAVQRELGVPVKLIGLGEGADRPGSVRAGRLRGRPDRRLTRLTPYGGRAAGSHEEPAARPPSRYCPGCAGVTTGGRRTPASPAAAAPAGSGGRVQHRGPQPADRAEAAEVGGRGGDVRARAQRPQVQVRVVPAHAVEQAGQFGGGPGGDEELRPAGRRHRHRAQRQPHPLQPHQRPPPGLLRHVQDVEGAAHRQQHRGARGLGPGVRRAVQAGARRDLPGEAQRMGAGGRAGPLPARAGAVAGAGAWRHRPAPEPGVLGHRGGLGAAASPPYAGTFLADAADREAHAPSNGSDSSVVTTRSARVTLRRCNSIEWRAPWCARWCGAVRAPPSASVRSSSIVVAQVKRARRQSGSFEGVANGGVSAIPLARGVIVGLPSVHEPWEHVQPRVCLGQPGFLFDGGQLPYERQQARHSDSGSHDEGFSGDDGEWGRSGERQRRRRYGGR
ncbi:Signal recognition particle receptor FtsY [Streptomyces cyaneofuscatus]